MFLHWFLLLAIQLILIYLFPLFFVTASIVFLYIDFFFQMVFMAFLSLSFSFNPFQYPSCYKRLYLYIQWSFNFITSTIFNVALFNFLRHLPSSLDTSNLTSCRPISSQCSLQYIEKNECHLSVVIFYSTNAADDMYVTFWYLRMSYL